MTEEEAQAWLRDQFGPDRYAALDGYRQMLATEAGKQNLIAASTIDTIWSRHIVDSAQLVALGAGKAGLWVDVGSGAGLPGIVVALNSDREMLLVEPRRLRVEFLNRCIAELGLEQRVSVFLGKVERLQGVRAGVISARAVANLPALFAGGEHVASEETLWLLPKGASAKSEVADARRSWQGVFHVEQSIVDPASGIVVARGVKRR